MTSEAETIVRDGAETTAALYADLQMIWTQYQSWQEHELLLAKSQNKLSGVSPDMAKELEDLLGDQGDLALAGQQLQAALMERLKELDNPSRQAKLTPAQQQELTQIRTRLSREIELRSLGSSDRNYDREW